jgi:hypothetical protein
MSDKPEVPQDLRERYEHLMWQMRGSAAQQRYARFDVMLIERIARLESDLSALRGKVESPIDEPLVNEIHPALVGRFTGAVYVVPAEAPSNPDVYLCIDEESGRKGVVLKVYSKSELQQAHGLAYALNAWAGIFHVTQPSPPGVPIPALRRSFNRHYDCDEATKSWLTRMRKSRRRTFTVTMTNVLIVLGAKMAVYVDDMRAHYGRMIMCHMAADTTRELLMMAGNLGISRRWIQHEGTWREHFDVCLTKRARAIELGAIGVTRREFATFVSSRRNDGL